MIFGLKKIPHRLIFMSYDDVETPTALIGKKLAPILHLHGQDPLPESLDIIKRVDEDAMLVVQFLSISIRVFRVSLTFVDHSNASMHESQ